MKIDPDAQIILGFAVLVAVFTVAAVVDNYTTEMYKTKRYEACVAHHPPQECKTDE